ncbi:type II toxin-antitoxin system RelE/ParE family toxin [Candidatus Gracilibacteria bacterium]|nr:type II toxin-antitoxin system RelE/ParE family toxin [Candidatus Gracilibacteria bacterium]
MYDLKIHRSVFKFLERREKNFLKKFKELLQLIRKDPFKNPCDVTPLVNRKGHFRLRIGKYRFLYEVNKKEVFIYLYKADSRGGVYK